MKRFNDSVHPATHRLTVDLIALLSALEREASAARVDAKRYAGEDLRMLHVGTVGKVVGLDRAAIIAKLLPREIVPIVTHRRRLIRYALRHPVSAVSGLIRRVLTQRRTSRYADVGRNGPRGVERPGTDRYAATTCGGDVERNEGRDVERNEP